MKCLRWARGLPRPAARWLGGNPCIEAPGCPPPGICNSHTTHLVQLPGRWNPASGCIVLQYITGEHDRKCLGLGPDPMWAHLRPRHALTQPSESRKAAHSRHSAGAHPTHATHLQIRPSLSDLCTTSCGSRANAQRMQAKETAESFSSAQAERSTAQHGGRGMRTSPPPRPKCCAIPGPTSGAPVTPPPFAPITGGNPAPAPAPGIIIRPPIPAPDAGAPPRPPPRQGRPPPPPPLPCRCCIVYPLLACPPCPRGTRTRQLARRPTQVQRVFAGTVYFSPSTFRPFTQPTRTQLRSQCAEFEGRASREAE